MVKEKYPENPIEVLIASLMDYKKIISKAFTSYPEDSELKELNRQYNSSFCEFEKTVKSKKYKSYSNDSIQNIIDIFEALSEEGRACLLLGLGSYIDVISESANSEEAGEDILQFYESLVNLFNDVTAVFSELNSSYTYHNLLTDMISDGYARFTEHKVLFDSFQEQLATFDNKSFDINSALKFYDGLNVIEKNYFMEDFLLSYIENTEVVLEDLENKGASADSMKNMIDSLVAAKKLNRALVKHSVN